MFLRSYQQECVKINTASKAALDTRFPSRLCGSPHAQTSMHAYAQEMRGVACYQANQGQQGLFDQRRGPSGHWASTAYATAPTYRETNPHFISHICSIAQNKLIPEEEKKRNSRCVNGQIPKGY